MNQGINELLALIAKKDAEIKALLECLLIYIDVPSNFIPEKETMPDWHEKVLKLKKDYEKLLKQHKRYERAILEIAAREDVQNDPFLAEVKVIVDQAIPRKFDSI